jgi:hypothetical protein
MRKNLLMLIASVMLLSSCATASTGADMIALHYKGGATQAKKFENCLPPSSRSGFDPGDAYYGYPVRQVSYDATGSESSESEQFKVVSNDGAELYVPVTVTFNLITDCETLRKMHETIGSRYSAYYDASGSTSDSNEGWVDMLNFVIGKPLDATLDRVAQQYNWRDIWNDPKVKAEMERAVNDSIDDLVNRQAGGEFFTNFSVLVQKPDPVNNGLKNAIAQEQTKVAQAKAQELQARADKARAEAQEAVAKAEAANKRAAIEGFKLQGMSADEAMEAYLKSQAIAKGINPWQPSGSGVLVGRN